jgi:hypothetical protein
MIFTSRHLSQRNFQLFDSQSTVNSQQSTVNIMYECNRNLSHIQFNFSLNAAEKSAWVQWALKAVDISTKNC